MGPAQWLPTDRRRRVLAFRYQRHDEPLHGWFGEPPKEPGKLPSGWGGAGQKPQPTPSGSFEEVVPLLAPETLELIAYAPGEGETKAIASQRVVTLSPPQGAQTARL